MVNNMQGEDYSINSIKFQEYDFMDFGCSKGESIKYGQNKFGGKKGIGIDIDYEKVKMARHYIKTSDKLSDGHTAICEDITQLVNYNIASKVRFTTAIHFLEHVNGMDEAEIIMESAANLSEEFVYISQPFADMDSQLFKMGLKTYYSDWTGHKNLMTSYDFYKICRNMYYRDTIKDFVIFGTVAINDSSNNYIHPIDSPINQHEYNEKIHPPKDNNITFNGLYKDINVLMILNDDFNFEKTISSINKDYEIIYDSRISMEKNRQIKISNCDFVDIGFGNGNSLKFAVEKFGAKTGLGIEKDYNRIAQVKAKIGDFKNGFGYHKLICKNIFDLNSKDTKFYKQFRLSTGINLIEEFDSVDQLEVFIKILSNLCTDFSFISHVTNDYDDYLESLGFQTSLRNDAKNHLFMTCEDYIELLGKLRDESVITDFAVFKRNRILDTSHSNICPINKDNIRDMQLDDFYINLDVFISYTDDIDFIELTRCLKGESVLIYSSKDHH